MPVGIFSKGIIKTVPYLEVFLQDKVIYNPKTSDGLTAIAGWGYKPTSRKAREKALEWNLPYLALEDGFIRSVGLGFEEPPLSLIVDPVGIYYDATKPSLLENIINSGEIGKNENLLEAGEFALEVILKNKISKYNNGAPVPKDYFPKTDKARILLVDQTFEDMSVKLGLADEKSFIKMVDYVVKNYSNGDIYVKLHPETIKGRKKGYLSQMKLPKSFKVIRGNFNPLDLLKYFDIICTVSSQIGFEALLLGKEVICFGMPFYAGWGLTKDMLFCERRNARPTILQLFTACYLVYPKYINPHEKKLGDIFDVLEYMVAKIKEKQK